MKVNVSVLAMAAAVALACSAEAAPASSETANRSAPERNRAAEIVTQPVRDVGVARTKIPPALAEAAEDPYSLKGLRNCRQLGEEIQQLNQVLGPDFQRDADYRENRVTKLAEAGGKTVVNSVIPFRSLVREVSGAATADRRLRAAEDAAYARRGFLRGVHATRGCRPRT